MGHVSRNAPVTLRWRAVSEIEVEVRPRVDLTTQHERLVGAAHILVKARQGTSATDVGCGGTAIFSFSGRQNVCIVAV